MAMGKTGLEAKYVQLEKEARGASDQLLAMNERLLEAEDKIKQKDKALKQVGVLQEKEKKLQAQVGCIALSLVILVTPLLSWTK